MFFLQKNPAKYSTNSPILRWDKAETLQGPFCKKITNKKTKQKN